MAPWPADARSRLWLGVQGALPVVMGYVPIGLALGVLAAGAGLTPLETGAMSAFVYAGASQFIGVAMLGAGAAPIAIALTAFLVNLRHLLMSAALSPYMRRLTRRHMALFSFFITDETFAVSATEFRERGEADPLYMVGLYGIAYSSWLLSTIAGAVAGNAFAIPSWLPLDFALPAMFLGLLAGQIKDVSGFIVALGAGLITLMTSGALGGWSVMVASIVGALIGTGVSRWTLESS